MNNKRERKKKKPAEITETTQASNKKWTVEDKKKLLRAIRMHGHTDMNKISEMVETKTPSSVKLMINKMMRRARSSGQRECSALETWVQSKKFCDENLPVPQALKFISIFEKHPTPEESNGFDFRAAYNHLHLTALGLPTTELPQETYTKFEKLVIALDENIWPAAKNDILSYLRTFTRRKRISKQYPSMSELESRKTIGPDRD